MTHHYACIAHKTAETSETLVERAINASYKHYTDLSRDTSVFGAKI